MKIAFDLDGVVANFGLSFRLYILEKYNYDVWYEGTNNREFKFTVPGVTESQMYSHVIDVIRNEWIHPFPEAIMGLEMIYEKTQEPIYFLTARPEKKVREETIAWVKENVTVPASVGFAGSLHKLKHLQKRGFDTFVEDRFKTANILAKELNKVFLVNRTYNIGRQEHENVTRINNLWEIDICKK